MIDNGKHVEPGAGPEDLFADEGYDESQRAEILEAEGRGPTANAIQTNILPDLGGGDADDDEIEDDADDLDDVEDTDDAFRTVNTLGGADPADLNPDDADRIGIQGNESDTNRKDTQNVT